MLWNARGHCRFVGVDDPQQASAPPTVNREMI